jgi:AcrR family transcriptional regulator/RimJ/RimL family protein N-acetyltransferase
MLESTALTTAARIRMAKSDEEIRAVILDAAAGLFAEHGFSGTKVNMVAKAAGVSSATVRRLTGGRAELFEQVMSARVTSTAAERMAVAVEHPGVTPPIAVILAVAEEVFASPDASWDILELEALTRAHLDGRLREIETERMQRRWNNAAALVAQIRATGGLDADVSDGAIVQLAIAMSAGLALLDPVIARKPTMAQWVALIARVGQAIAPQDMLLGAEFETRQPWRVRVDISEQPGAVARLVRALASLHAYVVAMQIVGHTEGLRTIDIALTTPVTVTADVIAAAALSVGRNAHVGEGSEEDALDLPTRILDGAAALVKTPEWTPLAAAELVEADEVEVTSATEGEDDSPDVLRLQWTPDRHVVLQRSWAPFAWAERTRASALLRLSSAIATMTGSDEAVGWVEPIKGGTVWIRLARPEDADAVAAMHDRCSERSRYQRYFSITDWHGTKLYRLSGGHRGATLVVMSEDGSIVGLGNVFPDPAEGDHAAEIAMIVEDAYQGRGVGKRLLQAMLHLAVRLGFTEVVATVLADNNGMLHLFNTSGLNWDTTIHDGVASMRAPLPLPLGPPVEVEKAPVRKRAPRKAAVKAPARKAATKAPARKAATKAPARKAAKKTPAKRAPRKKAPAADPSGS